MRRLYMLGILLETRVVDLQKTYLLRATRWLDSTIGLPGLCEAK
jgi:hypothetical protein